MRSLLRNLSVVLFIGTMIVCAAPSPSALAAEGNAVAEGNTAFTCDLYAQLARKEQGNLFFSPVSIHAVLAMTYAGSRGNTAAEMARTMHYPANQEELAKAYGLLLKDLNTPRLDWEKKPSYDLVVANALWGQQGYPFLEPFLALNREHYGAGLNLVDFAQGEVARKTINDWVEKQTRDRIKDLIPQGLLNAAMRLVLTNAIYFKSQWEEPFKADRTEDAPFTRVDGEQVKVPLMHLQRHFGYGEDADVQVLQLPYRRNELSMLVILPRKNGGLPAVEKSLSVEMLNKWLRLQSAKVDVALPKFKIESSFSLADQLKALGMNDAFSAGKADFTGIAKTPEGLYISDVIHKSFVEVDENGTEAAAATAVVMKAGGLPRPEDPKLFKADHPFLFLIRHHRTGEILFAGRVMDPH